MAKCRRVFGVFATSGPSAMRAAETEVHTDQHSSKERRREARDEQCVRLCRSAGAGRASRNRLRRPSQEPFGPTTLQLLPKQLKDLAAGRRKALETGPALTMPPARFAAAEYRADQARREGRQIGQHRTVLAFAAGLRSGVDCRSRGLTPRVLYIC